MSRIGILELCSLVFLAVIFLEAVQRRQFKRFLVLLIIWIGVTGFALFYLRESTDGLVSFGDDESRIWAFAAILIGAILGIGARYVFYLEQTGKFTWFGLLKPLCISPIVVLPCGKKLSRPLWHSDGRAGEDR